MKNFAVRILFVVCILNLNTGFAQQTDTNDYQIIDGVIAVVGRNMIKESELETSFLQAKSQVGIMEDAFDTRCNIFESMLINKLMLHQAEIDSIEVTDEEITRELDSRIKQMIRAYGSQEVMEKMMKKSVSEIKTIYRDLIRENIMIAQIDQKLTGTINITPQEVVDFYQSIPQDSLPVIEQEYRFAQIVKLPKISDEEKEAVKSRLNDYRERILKGSKFSTLATLYSDDPASAKQGGELGFFSRGDMVAEFENAAFSLQEGEISPIIETQYGFHIIQLIERRGNQVNCRHILLQPKISEVQMEQARKELNEIKDEIAKGEITFEDAVVKYSDDASKINGGVIVNPYNASASFSKDAINETMQNVDRVDFDAMKEGDITDPVRFKSDLADAYRLIKVTRKTSAHKVNLTEDYDKIQESALNSKKTDIIKEWAEKRIKNTYININPEYRDCNFKLNWLKK